MARIHHHAGSSARSDAGAERHRAALQKQKPSYKVVLEQVTEKKKKSLTAYSRDSRPPPGYTFIPAGDPQVSNRCKRFAKEDGLKIYIVSTRPTKGRQGPLDVHRVGYHFPSVAVERACQSLGVTLSNGGQVLLNTGRLAAAQAKSKRSTGNKRKRQMMSPVSDVSQATLDTQAREAIRDLFPRLPEVDLHEILVESFQKGTKKVGAQNDLPLLRRVQLAVAAHVRHMYTDYDQLLRKGSWVEARQKVTQRTLDVLALWRGDEENDPEYLEDILREVIVIPDDDDDEEQDDFMNQRKRPESADADRASSIELLEFSSQAVDYSSEQHRTNQGRRYSPDFDQDELIQYQNSGEYQFEPHLHQESGEHLRNETRRRQAWEQALERRQHIQEVVYVSDDAPLPRRRESHQWDPVEDTNNHRVVSGENAYWEVDPHRNTEIGDRRIIPLRRIDNAKENITRHVAGPKAPISTNSSQIYLPRQEPPQNERGPAESDSIVLIEQHRPHRHEPRILQSIEHDDRTLAPVHRLQDPRKPKQSPRIVWLDPGPTPPEPSRHKSERFGPVSRTTMPPVSQGPMETVLVPLDSNNRPHFTRPHSPMPASQVTTSSYRREVAARPGERRDTAYPTRQRPTQVPLTYEQTLQSTAEPTAHPLAPLEEFPIPQSPTDVRAQRQPYDTSFSTSAPRPYGQESPYSRSMPAIFQSTPHSSRSFDPFNAASFATNAAVEHDIPRPQKRVMGSQQLWRSDENSGLRDQLQDMKMQPVSRQYYIEDDRGDHGQGPFYPSSREAQSGGNPKLESARRLAYQDTRSHRRSAVVALDSEPVLSRQRMIPAPRQYIRSGNELIPIEDDLPHQYVQQRSNNIYSIEAGPTSTQRHGALRYESLAEPEHAPYYEPNASLFRPHQDVEGTARGRQYPQFDETSQLPQRKAHKPVIVIE